MSPTVRDPYHRQFGLLIVLGRVYLSGATSRVEEFPSSFITQLPYAPSRSDIPSPIPGTSRCSQKQAILLRGELT